MTEGTFVKSVTEKTKTEDGEGKCVTGSERVAIEEAGKDLIMIFLACNYAENIHQLYCFVHNHVQKGSTQGYSLPECGIECYGEGRNCVVVS